MFKNRTKEKLLAGQPVWGVMTSDPSPYSVEALGYAGFDWILLDNEHGFVTVDAMEGAVRACEVTGMTPIVRPIMATPEFIRPFMDLGAHGVQVPQVDTPEQARVAVDAVKYTPLGKRGLGPSRYSRGYSGADWVRVSNEETLVCIMIESPLGVANAGAIASVPGVDVVFVGQGDLSLAMGYPGQMAHPEVTRAAASAVDAILAAGKVAGCSCPIDAIGAWLERGVRYFHSSFGAVVTAGAQQYLGIAKEAMKSQGIEPSTSQP